MKLELFVIATIAALISASTFVNADASSIVGTFSDGYELGKKRGQAAYENGNGHNSKCPSNLSPSISHCAGYKAGYEVGWVSAANLGDN
jgi:hypothetical protein